MFGTFRRRNGEDHEIDTCEYDIESKFTDSFKQKSKRTHISYISVILHGPGRAPGVACSKKWEVHPDSMTQIQTVTVTVTVTVTGVFFFF
jgi:hypothetical protein